MAFHINTHKLCDYNENEFNAKHDYIFSRSYDNLHAKVYVCKNIPHL